MADNTSMIAGLFSSPEQYQLQQNQLAEQNAIQMAQLTPEQRAVAGLRSAGNMVGGGIGRLMGAEDPQMKLIGMRQAILQGVNPNDSASLGKAAEALAKAGDQQGAMQLAQKALEIRNTESQIAGRTEERQAQREMQMQMSREKIQAQVEMAKEKLQAQIDMAKERGATAVQIAQMRADASKEIAALTAALKGPSAAVLKAEERATKIAEGKEGLADTVEVAKTLVEDLAKSGGMTSTAKGPLSNLITSLSTNPVGQFGERLIGTKDQAKRDELSSIRLQLLNAVKEATGMSATQLNSNIELKTWLDSLGSAGMTKEANLAILNNISNRYLKGKAMVPSSTPENVPKGTVANPIVLK